MSLGNENARKLVGCTATAEWGARFDDLVKGYRKRMREVAIGHPSA